MKKYIGLFFAAAMMSSCVDTIIVPYDKTVEEDYWQSKSDVSQMVNGTYNAMLASGFVQRLVVWGDFRSDELTSASSLNITNTTTTGLSQLESGNIETTNTFADWSSFYYVINNCNVVLEKAGAVVDIDPNYTEGDYLADCSQMKALRALCYFYLVRTFRDVPYSTVAFMNSSQDMNLGQTAPATVIDNCIKDVEEALPNALSAQAYTDWRNYGYINRDGMRALLADLYLWRASVNHSAADYQKSIEYCDMVIDSKKSMNSNTESSSDGLAGYPLTKGSDAFSDIFVSQNSDESIFELQYDGTQNSNEGICQLYNKYKNSTGVAGYMEATSLFASASASNVYTKTSDYRLNANRFTQAAGSTSETYPVRKMVSDNAASKSDATSSEKKTDRAYTNYAQNFIIYRLTDVMLMKAEALAQLAPDDTDENASDEEKATVKANQEKYLHDAFRLVQVVNNRSIATSSLSSDSLTWSRQTQTKAGIEELVLEERQRELAFEGKRWFDLLRYNYRHVSGIDYTKTLGDMSDEGVAFVDNYKNMLDLLRNVSAKAVMVSKTKTEPYLYLPVLEGQIKVNANLKQNPAYKSKTLVKN